MSYYDILEVSPGASQETIKAAYRALCKKYHPDVCQDPNGQKKMKLINEAYEVLSDKNRRTSYDSTLENGKKQKTESTAAESTGDREQKSRISETEKTGVLNSISMSIIGLLGGVFYVLYFLWGLLILAIIIGLFTGHSQVFFGVLYDWILNLLLGN